MTRAAWLFLDSLLGDRCECAGREGTQRCNVGKSRAEQSNNHVRVRVVVVGMSFRKELKHVITYLFCVRVLLTEGE